MVVSGFSMVDFPEVSVDEMDGSIEGCDYCPCVRLIGTVRSRMGDPDSELPIPLRNLNMVACLLLHLYRIPLHVVQFARHLEARCVPGRTGEIETYPRFATQRIHPDTGRWSVPQVDGVQFRFPFRLRHPRGEDLSPATARSSCRPVTRRAIPLWAGRRFSWQNLWQRDARVPELVA
jgi:hypothetical protein